MSIYVWNSEPKEIYIWNTPVKEVYVWTTKVRPAFKHKTFTISWTEKSNMSSWWTYSDDAAWLTAWDTAFDEFFWYYGCRLNASGVETAKITQEESWWAWKLDITKLWTLTSGDNVMIAFPVMWIKMSKSWSTVTLSITKELNKDWYQYYAHSTWTLSNPWTPKDVFYLGAYKWYSSSNTLKSWSGKTPTNDQTISTFCTYAKANGSWYNIIGFYQRMFINALYMMKYGNPNSQSVVWWWFTYKTWISAPTSTWDTNSQTNSTYWVVNNYVTHCKLFWLEDRWGNCNERLWWAYLDSSKVLYTQLTWWTWAASWWVSTWTTLNTPSWWNYNYILSSIAGNNKAMFAPTSVINTNAWSSYYAAQSRAYAGRVAYAWWGFIEDGSWKAWWALKLWIVYENTSTWWTSAWCRLMYMNWLT